MKKKRIVTPHFGRGLNQILRKMKLTVFFSIVLVVTSWGKTLSQTTRLSLNMKNVPVQKMIEQIEDLTEFYFLYQDDVFRKDQKVTIESIDATVESIMQQMAEQASVQYRIFDRQIVLLPVGDIDLPAGLKRQLNSQIEQKKSITGKVTDSSGGSLPGVSIVVKGTTTGTITDDAGNFSLQVPVDAKTLVFSFVGMVAQELAIDGQTTFKVVMADETVGIDEVVAIGYGTVRKSDLTGSVSGVKTEDLKYIPSSRIDNMLQGRTSGVQITQTNGSPGAGTVIRVRGGNSIEGNNEPLWVIDGIIVGQNFDLNNINPNDIKSIEVLKDASSVAIYGSRGANGVMLVTTKAGTGIPGKPSVSLNLSTGWQTPVYKPQFLDGLNEAEYANEDSRYRNLAEPYPDLSKVTDTDWYDLLVATAPISNMDMTVSGTSNDRNINYYVSANYFDQEGIVANSGIVKYIFRTHLDIKLSPKVTIGTRINFSRLERKNGTVDYGSITTQMSSKAVFNADGTYTASNPVNNVVEPNAVFNSIYNVDNTFTNNLLGTVYLEYKPTKELVIKTTLNPEINNVKSNLFISSQSPNYLAVGDRGNATVSALSGLGWNNENTLLYTPTLSDDHKLSVLGGFTVQKFTAESVTAKAFGITTDALQFNNLSLASNPTRNVVGSDFDAFQVVSYLSRINYSYKSKYLATLVGRYDGSSRFATGNKYAFFPSVALAWNLDQEQFISDLGIFHDLKIRASYGKSGSQAIDSYRTLAIMMDASSTYNGILNAGSTLGRPQNPNLKWETTKQLDIGLEAGFFGGRLTTEIDYYHKNTYDLLLNVQIPRMTGFDTQLKNLGIVENKGLELLVNSVNISKSDLKWSTSITVSGNRNKVLDLAGSPYINRIIPNATQGVAGRLVVGQPAPVFVGVNYLGTWKSQADIDATNQINQRLGGAHYEDKDGDGRITENDVDVIGSPQPDFIFGCNNSIQYKNWDFSFYFQGTVGNEVFNTLTDRRFFGEGSANKYLEVLNRWTPENPTSDIPRAGTYFLTSIPNNSMMVEDGSHLRLKSSSLAYHLPLEKIGLKKFDDITLYVNGSNLALWSDFRLKDPETSKYGTENVAQGFSSAEYPAPRTITFGIKATF